MKNIIIIGTGTIAKETVKIIEAINFERETWNIIGFISTDDNNECNNIDGYKIISNLGNIYAYFENKKKDKFSFFKRLESDNELFAVIGIDNYDIKKEIVAKLNNKVKFAKLIHPNIKNMCINKISDGCIIYPGLISVGELEIGKHSIIKQSCSFGNNVKIGEFSFISFNSNIDSNVIIGDEVYIEPNTTVLANNKIEKDSYVKTGSLIY